MSLILQDNNIVKNIDQKLINNISVNEVTTNNGKIAEYLNGNWQNTEGYLQIWYNSIGTNHFIQNSVGYRPKIENAAKKISIKNETVLNYMTTTSILTFQTMMFVYQYNYRGRFLYYSGSDSIGGISNGIPFPTFGFSLQNIIPIIKMNDVIYTLNTVKSYGFYVVCATFRIPVYFATYHRLNNSQLNTAETDIYSKYLEYVFYNRILSDAEITYNTNALRTKFNF